MPATSLDQIISLCKRRGFIFPGSEIYGGLQGTYDYGPLGVELKNNLKRLWWKHNVYERDDMEGIETALLTNRYVLRYGLRLLPDLYEGFNPMTREEAQSREVEMAIDLRSAGFGVWQA